MAMRSGLLEFRLGHAVWCVLAWSFWISPWVDGEILRLSKVVPEGTVDAGRFEYQNVDEPQTLFVANQAIITGADVKSVMRSPQQVDALAVILTEEGGKKLGAATKDAHGDMRIAVLIDEEVILAPVVNAQIGNQFVIDGLKEYSDAELDLLVWRIEGKGDDEIARLLREKEMSDLAPPPPRPEPEYYSDEEYEALKKQREKIGIFYVDQLPAAEELEKRLNVGMTRAAVVNEFGRASRTTSDENGNLTSMGYDLAPERYSLSTEMRPCGFSIHYSKDRVTRWAIDHYGNSPRTPKPPKGGPRALSAVFPQADFSRKDFNLIRWVEEIQISINEGEESATTQDYMDLLSIICNCAMAAEDVALIDTNCSVVKTLAEGFSEVEALRRTAKDGKISLSKLHDLLKPYIFGQKPFPEPAAAPK